MRFVEVVATVIMDCLEECLDTFTLSMGKEIIRVWGVTVVFLLFSLASWSLKIPVFITWSEAVVAVIIMTAITALDYGNKASLMQLKKSIKSVSE